VRITCSDIHTYESDNHYTDPIPTPKHNPNPTTTNPMKPDPKIRTDHNPNPKSGKFWVYVHR